ncbi:MAG: hypothetical protein AB8B80_01235 [Marinicellaceae bacterium]
MKLLALIIAYLVSHVISKPVRFRNFKWYEYWKIWFLDKSYFKHQELNLLITIFIPIVIICLLIDVMTSSMVGSLLASILVLAYCIGPESLEEDVESGDIRSQLSINKEAEVSTLIKKMTEVSLKRWFGVFFWYIILGIFGALMYRLAERHDLLTKDNDLGKASINALIKILNYPVAWMMVVSLSIASDFERVLKKCKPFMNLDNMKKLDTTFLYESTDFAVEICEVDDDNKQSIEKITLSVLKRMLLVWLVFVSIFVIFAN